MTDEPSQDGMSDATVEIATVDEIAPVGLPVDAAATAVAPAPRARRRLPRPPIRATAGGIAAVGMKELRGRMRGRRAFAILTGYLIMLGGFAWMVEVMMERATPAGFGGQAAFATAGIGQAIFVGLMMLETLLVVVLAPMSTAGSISLEREKQTLDMLAATPINSFAIVVGKLLSALIYVWLLIAASIPLTAVVFVFGGVAPDDLLRGYLVLIVTALGLGSFGLFCSSLVKRTQAATAITIFGVLTVTLGSLVVLFFIQSLATPFGGRGPVPAASSATGPIAYVNPFLAQADIAPADVLCTTDGPLRYYCRFRETFLYGVDGGVIFTDTGFGRGPIAVPVEAPVPADGPLLGNETGAVGVGGFVDVDFAPNDIAPFGAIREEIWSKSVATWLILSGVFLALSVQLVSPTRRWRPGLPRRSRGSAA